MSTITTAERNYLLDNMKDLLDEYDYNYSTDALDEIIDTWADNKANLIEAFRRHPNYIEGKFMIAFDCDFERATDITEIRRFSSWIYRATMNELCTANYDQVNFLYCLDEYTDQFITSELANIINRVFPEAKAVAGQKMSRVINKICTLLGLSKLADYNREFAKYADALNPLLIKRHTVLSVNPLDYLTMSFGNSWASCHTIDKRNKRDMPNNYSGCYSSGTISYMLDEPSMVFYTVDASYNGNEYWDQPKINRQMFHYAEDKLVQGRLYPQDNDGNNSAYTPYRNIVQKIISEIFDFPNLWKVSRDFNCYIYSKGTHYKDYCQYENCNMSRPNGNENENYMTIGHMPICIECGNEHDTEDNINCCYSQNVCSSCGRRISNDEAYFINDEAYCNGCVSYCDICDNYYPNGDGTYIASEDRYVCDSCLDQYYTQCERCGEYVDNECVTHVESEYDVCSDCLEEYYSICAHCGEWHRTFRMFEHNGVLYCRDCYSELFECAEQEENE